jgi:cellulose synthase/poly-beta-1,6-N-acetylglucosamine synthase-like glycosyltransferase
MAIPLVLAIFSGLVSLIWLSRHLQISRELGRDSALNPDSPGVAGPPPCLSVIVAARDEERNIRQCVRGWLRQDYPDFELIIVNDRSSDATAELAAQEAGSDRRFTLLNVEELPEGWCGKNHAMHMGVQAAVGRWLLFSDADVRQLSDRTLAVAVGHATDTDADLLTMLPNLAMESFWECVVQPACSGIMMVWFHPDKVNDPANPNAYANGAFMLFRRQAYDAVGGHEAVKGVICEDLALARRTKAAGKRLRVIRNRELYDVRMYSSFRQIWRGWTRILHGSFHTARRFIIAMLLILLVSLSPYAVAAVGLAMTAAGAQWPWWWLAAGATGAAAAALQLSAIWRFYPMTGARRSLFWTFPLGGILALGIIATAFTKLRKGATIAWRGHHYASKGS